MSNSLISLIDNWSIFNQSCLLCGSSHTKQLALCHSCLEMLPTLPVQHCPQCAEPSVDGSLCGRCQTDPPGFDALHAPYLFDYPLNGLIHSLKYGKQLQISKTLGHLLAKHAVNNNFKMDLVIPIPLSKERLAERGFNQSDELAKAITGTIPTAFSAKLCWRKRNTLPQASLSRQERQLNVRDAFGVKQRVDGLSIAIVDDVATSGATLSAVAKLLKKEGANRVEAWVLARAFPPKT